MRSCTCWEKPPGINNILAIWALSSKLSPNGRINKHKARICAHDGIQKYGVNYWEKYSPTVNWISDQFLMIVAQSLKLDTKVINFVLAFTQAELHINIFII